MGLFGPKKSAEEKQFIKALKDAAHLKEKHITALMEATAAYPAGWQGHWFTALYYDFAPYKGGTPDPQKAQEYFLKAEAAAKGTPGEAWIHSFLTWYRRPAGNLIKPLNEAEEKIRRLCVALMNNYKYKSPVVMAPADKKDDAGTFSSVIIACSRDVLYEYDAAVDYFNGLDTLWMCRDRQDFVDAINPIIKKYNKANDAYTDCMKAISKDREPNWHKLNDMYAYMLAHNCIDDGPFITGELATSWGVSSEAALGIQFYLFAARNGNQPAIHELVRLAHASQSNYNLMESVFRRVHPSHIDMGVYLLEQLYECIKKDDDEAMRLVELYYADEMAKLSE